MSELAPLSALLGEINSAQPEQARSIIPQLVSEARRLGIAIEPPDVNRNASTLSLHDEDAESRILWGLSLLPGWDRATAEELVSERPSEGFATLAALASAAIRTGLSVSQVESLVLSGACDRLGGIARSRAGLLAALPSVFEGARNTTKGPQTNQYDLFTLAEAHIAPEPPSEESTHATSMTPRERYAQRMWEEECLGVAFTPADEVEELRRALDGSGHLRSRLLSTAQVDSQMQGKSICLVGLLCSIELHPDPHPTQGEPLATAWIEDLDGCIELVAFPPSYKRHGRHWVENSLVIVTGRVGLHRDGEVYLLCEHLAPYNAGEDEGEINLEVKPTRKGKARPASVEPEVIASTNSTPPDKTREAATAVGATQAAVSVALEPAPSATPTHRLIVTLPASEDDHSDIDTMIALQKLLEQHPGEDAVVLRIPYLPEKGAVTRAQLPRGVRYSSQLEREIREMLGYDALALIRLVG